MLHATTEGAPSRHALILWDIDGTLLNCSGAGESALLQALRDGFGVDGNLEGIAFGGRTDVWIARQLFSRHDIEFTQSAVDRFLGAYAAALPEALKRRAVHVFPGARECVERLAAAGYTQGLLTGNIELGARAKLRAANLDHHFAFGAFGCDSEDRNHLGPHALRRAHARLGIRFEPSRACIIGDTPHDIACARAIGAHAIAVAQGRHGLEELRAHAPEAALPSLSNPADLDAALAALGL